MLWNDNQPSKPGGYETIRQLSEIDGVRCPHCGAPTVLGVGLALLVETRVGEAHPTTFNSWVSRWIGVLLTVVVADRCRGDLSGMRFETMP